nr:alpha/beta hydrolase [Maliibacterium massiliense]
MAYFTYNGKKCFYSEQGAGTPLLLLHGNTASSNMFYHAAPRYADAYKVVLMDFLGHGQSARLDAFPTDLWYDEAQQVISFLTQKGYARAHLIGSSGGALVAMNVALERPDLVGKVIADSFEGAAALEAFTQNIIRDRDASKRDADARFFYEAMHGPDWEQVVDNDTQAIYRHSRTNGRFFHKPLASLACDILLTGSRQDPFIAQLEPDYFSRVYGDMLAQIGHGRMHLFAQGDHPALLSNMDAFVSLSRSFLSET